MMQTICVFQELMVVPVIAADGHTYEKSAMEQWLQQCDTSPVTGTVLQHKHLVPNVSIKQAVAAFAKI